MPQIDLRYIKVAKYINTSGTITYSNKQTAGDAMTANLTLRSAEGRLYAESSLAEYLKKAVGGSISLGVKYLPTAVQKLMYGMTEKSRSVTYTVGTSEVTESVSGLMLASESTGNYVGVAFYAPDMVDGVLKYTCMFVPKALFGPPDHNFQTAGDGFNFQTPITTGEFMRSDASTHDLLEFVTVDSEAAAKAWVDAVLNAS